MKRDTRIREIKKVRGKWIFTDDGSEAVPHPCWQCGRTKICDKCAVRIACLFGKQGDLFA